MNPEFRAHYLDWLREALHDNSLKMEQKSCMGNPYWVLVDAGTWVIEHEDAYEFIAEFFGIVPEKITRENYDEVLGLYIDKTELIRDLQEVERG